MRESSPRRFAGSAGAVASLAAVGGVSRAGDGSAAGTSAGTASAAGGLMVASLLPNASRKVEAGVSIVSDGELGKVGYSTYIIERLSGFGGHTPRKPALDLP